MKPMKRLAVWAGVVGFGVLLGGVQACGGSSKDDARDLDTGLPPDKTLDSLTEAEVRQACERLQGAVNARFSEETLTTWLCTFVTVGAATTEAICDAVVDECVSTLQDDPETTMMALDSCADTSMSQFDGCNATVAELEACSNDSLDSTEALLTRYSCKDAAAVGEDEATLAELDAVQPASCQGIEARCPGVTMTSDMFEPQ